jgi:quinol monooxygenase YgiN
MPLRAETLFEAWELTAAGGRQALPTGQVFALITMRAKPGMGERLEQAASEFVAATLAAPGALSSTLHRSGPDPDTWFLLERFADEAAFGRHMSRDYFRSFQAAQTELLDGPVKATFLARQ